jgi:hypothetical protein
MNPSPTLPSLMTRGKSNGLQCNSLMISPYQLQVTAWCLKKPTIAILRDSIPSIRRPQSSKYSNVDSGDHSHIPVEPTKPIRLRIPIAMAPPVNKPTIMEEACKYINTSERTVKELQNDTGHMKSQLATYQDMTRWPHSDGEILSRKGEDKTVILQSELNAAK